MQQLTLFGEKQESKAAEDTAKKNVAAPDKLLPKHDAEAENIKITDEQEQKEISEQQNEPESNEAFILNDDETHAEENEIVEQPQSKKATEIIPVKKRGRKSLKQLDAEADLIDVPDDETLFKKQYHTITEVAKWFNVNPSLLRFWTNEFTILKPKKNKKGDRFFRPEDVKTLKIIHHLLREKKYTIEGAKSYLKANAKNLDTDMQLLKTLNNMKAFILELKAQLEHSK